MGACTDLLRYEVSKDNSCLFAAFAMLCEPGLTDRGAVQRLREVCARDVLADPDPASRALAVGMPVAEYAEWIRDDTHWGGESEVLSLARHFAVEVAIASCESLTVLVYGADSAVKPVARIYLLYTGQHYDAFVGRAPDGQEVLRLPPGPDDRLEAAAVAQARRYNEEAERVARQRRVKRIRCGGCGALLLDGEAFQAHCREVEHGDDFAYTCTVVEVVVEGGEPLPDEHIDLDDTDRVHCFNNANASDPLSSLYPVWLEVDGSSYASLEHFWRAAAFLGSSPAVVGAITTAATAEAARATFLMADVDLQRPGWAQEREATLVAGVRAKFLSGDAAFRSALAATKRKLVVNVDPDPWMGMQALGGISSGRNHLGKALTLVRNELLRDGRHEGTVLEGLMHQVSGGSSWIFGCCPSLRPTQHW